MALKKKWFNYLIYISLLFVIYSLVKNDFLSIPDIYSLKDMSISIILLFLSIILQALNWHQILKNKTKISLKDAISSVGLSIFTKYIPGKVMVILSRAAFIDNKYGYSKKTLITRSLDAQIITLWIGLILGSVPFLSIESFDKYQIYYFIILILFSLFIFTKTFHLLGEKVISYFINRETKIPKLNFINTIKSLPSFILYWLLLTVSFYLFANSLTPETVSFWIGFTFPLAATLGIITLIAPGGIGAREGILVILLNSHGLDIKTATTISIASRLWFLLGEIFIFILAVIMETVQNKKLK